MNLNDCAKLAIILNYEAKYKTAIKKFELAKLMGMSVTNMNRFFNSPSYVVSMEFIENYATATKQDIGAILKSIIDVALEQGMPNTVKLRNDDRLNKQSRKSFNDFVRQELIHVYNSRYFYTYDKKTLGKRMNMSHPNIIRFFNAKYFSINMDFIQRYAEGTDQNAIDILIMIFNKYNDDDKHIPIWKEMFEMIGG